MSHILPGGGEGITRIPPSSSSGAAIAYGYSPIYNSYTYSEPIYGYSNLEPGQVIENVQVALRNQGYYPGSIDGLVGTQTRSALAAYQHDHGLVITSAIDEPTLVTLGLA